MGRVDEEDDTVDDGGVGKGSAQPSEASLESGGREDTVRGDRERPSTMVGGSAVDDMASLFFSSSSSSSTVFSIFFFFLKKKYDIRKKKRRVTINIVSQLFWLDSMDRLLS